MESIFEKRLTVTPDYCDASGALSPLAAFTIFQGIAAQHAEVLGVGSSAMAKKGEFWLTVHTRVDLFERAYLMDKLTVRTWAEACSERDVRTYRSYTLSRGEAGIARGKTEWAILGPEQKIIRFGDSGFPKDYPFPAETAIPEKLQRFHEKFEDADLFSHYAVRSTDIDLGHPGPYRVAELLDKPFFLTERNANYRRTFDRFLASRQIELTPSLEISDTSFIIKMLERSSGISLLPRFAVAEPASRGDLRILEVSDFRLTMYRQMFYHKDKCCTREMDAFIQLASGPDLPLL